MNNDQLDDMKYMLKTSLKAMLDNMYEKFAHIVDNLTSYATTPSADDDDNDPDPTLDRPYEDLGYKK